MNNADLRKRLQGIREGKWDEVADKIDALIADIVDNDEGGARLGFATNRQLLSELSARIELHHCGLDYRTVNEKWGRTDG
jgi:hypothetical protein